MVRKHTSRSADPKPVVGSLASVHRACHEIVIKHGGHNLDPKSGSATHSQQTNKRDKLIVKSGKNIQCDLIG